MICSDAICSDENTVLGTGPGLCAFVAGTDTADADTDARDTAVDAGVGVGVDLGIDDTSCAAFVFEVTPPPRSLDFRCRLAAGVAEEPFGVACCGFAFRFGFALEESPSCCCAAIAVVVVALVAVVGWDIGALTGIAPVLSVAELGFPGVRLRLSPGLPGGGAG